MLATLTAVDRTGNSIAVINHICTTFEAQLVALHISPRHAGPELTITFIDIVTYTIYMQLSNHTWSVSANGYMSYTGTVLDKCHNIYTLALHSSPNRKSLNSVTLLHCGVSA